MRIFTRKGWLSGKLWKWDKKKGMICIYYWSDTVKEGVMSYETLKSTTTTIMMTMMTMIMMMIMITKIR